MDCLDHEVALCGVRPSSVVPHGVRRLPVEQCREVAGARRDVLSRARTGGLDGSVRKRWAVAWSQWLSPSCQAAGGGAQTGRPAAPRRPGAGISGRRDLRAPGSPDDRDRRHGRGSQRHEIRRCREPAAPVGSGSAPGLQVGDREGRRGCGGTSRELTGSVESPSRRPLPSALPRSVPRCGPKPPRRPRSTPYHDSMGWFVYSEHMRMPRRRDMDPATRGQARVGAALASRRHVTSRADGHAGTVAVACGDASPVGAVDDVPTRGDHRGADLITMSPPSCGR